MKNDLYFYLSEPSVFAVGKYTEITVRGIDERYAFDEAVKYTVALLPMNANRIHFDAADYTIDAAVSGGKLHFAYAFPGEDEYFIRIFKDGERLTQIPVYALDDDLYALRPLKGDTHVHSCRSDGRESPAVVAANYRAAGFDFMALTDHHRYAPSLEAIDAYQGVRLGMTQMKGEEVHSPETYLHIVNFGGEFSVNKLFQDDKDAFYRDVAYIDRTARIPFDDPADRFVYASALWCVEKIRKAGGISVFPHPHWISNVFNVPDKMSRAFFLNDVFDAYELIGGQSAHENNYQTQLYYEMREEYLEKRGKRLAIPVLGASDSHGTINAGWFNRKYSIVFARSRAPQDILDAIRAGMSCAVEVYEDSANYNVHGAYRLSCYARFLCENYFPRTQAFMAMEGHLMREYVLGVEGAGELLNARADVSDRFWNTYAGK